MQEIRGPVEFSPVVDMIPAQYGQLSSLSHRLMAPPTTPQVSGWVMQASVWTPRSTHWLRFLSVLIPKFNWILWQKIKSWHSETYAQPILHSFIFMLNQVMCFQFSGRHVQDILNMSLNLFYFSVNHRMSGLKVFPYLPPMRHILRNNDVDLIKVIKKPKRNPQARYIQYYDSYLSSNQCNKVTWVTSLQSESHAPKSQSPSTGQDKVQSNQKLGTKWYPLLKIKW